MKCFNRILIFDFGTSKTRVCEDGKIVFDEPTEISYFSDGHIHIGYKARGYYSMHYDVINPIVNGGVNNYDAFEAYVTRVVRKLVRFPRLCLKTVVIAVPNDMIGNIQTTPFHMPLFKPFRKMGIKDLRAIPRGISLSFWVLRN